MSYYPPPPPLPRRRDNNPAYQPPYGYVPPPAPYQPVYAEQQSIARPQNNPPPLPPRPVQIEQQQWQPPLPVHPHLGGITPAYSSQHEPSPAPPQNNLPHLRKPSPIERITAALQNLSTGNSAQQNQQSQNNAVHYHTNTSWPNPQNASSTTHNMSIPSHAATPIQQLQQYQNRTQPPTYYPLPPPHVPLQASLSTTQASPASSGPYRSEPNFRQLPAQNQTPRTTANLINFFASQPTQESTSQYDPPQHDVVGLPSSSVTHIPHVPSNNVGLSALERAGTSLEKLHLQPSVEEAEHSALVTKSTYQPRDAVSGGPHASATAYAQPSQIVGGNQVGIDKPSTFYTPIDKEHPNEGASRQWTSYAAGHSAVQPTTSCRFRRPTAPPTNIPSSQASEYIYFDDCSSPHRFSVIWFRSSVAARFLVCATCFERHVRYTPLSASFTGKLETLGNDGRCMFSVPRVTDFLWPLNRSSDDLNMIHAYMNERSNLPSCKGVSGITGSKARAVGMTWYAPAHNAIPHFIACRACVEEHVVGMGFEHMFVPHTKQQGDTEEWACDIAIPYIQRLLKTTARSGDWSAFVTGAQHRISVPQCPSFKPVKANSRTWHRPRTWPESSVCESCFLDHIALTSLENEFTPAPVLLGARFNDWTCDLWSIPAQGAASAAVTRKDFEVFRHFFNVLTTNPACSPEGILGGKWYTLKGGCQNFDVCATCYTGLITTYYLDDEFQQRYDVPNGQTLACDFCPGVGRAIQYLNKFDEAFHSPHFDVFTSYVRRVANLAPCQGIELVKNAAWWRLNDTTDFYVCSECYENIIRDTVSSSIFTNVGTIAAEVTCCMYSSNMRTRYKNLCSTDSPTARTDFIDYANHRQSIYAQTVPVMRNIVAMAKFKLAQQRMNNAASSFYNAMDMTAGVNIHYGPGSGYKTVYGSSASGNWYNTPYGIESERLAAKAMGIVNGMGDDTMKVGMLERIWKEVE